MLKNIWGSIVRFFINRGFTMDTYANTLHLYGSFLLVVLFVGIFGVNFYVGLGMVATIGIVKELYDLLIRGKEFSWMDLVFDLIGILIGALFCAGILKND